MLRTHAPGFFRSFGDASSGVNRLSALHGRNQVPLTLQIAMVPSGLGFLGTWPLQAPGIKSQRREHRHATRRCARCAMQADVGFEEHGESPLRAG